jgi:hypothetical protein
MIKWNARTADRSGGQIIRINGLKWFFGTGLMSMNDALLPARPTVRTCVAPLHCKSLFSNITGGQRLYKR